MRELAKHVDVALDTLSLNHKAILILRESEGLSYEEISCVPRIPKGTVNEPAIPRTNEAAARVRQACRVGARCPLCSRKRCSWHHFRMFF